MKVEWMFTNTDSHTYHIHLKDVYKDLFEDQELFDYSDYNPKSEFYDPLKLIGLWPKMYSYVKESGKGDKKAKGVDRTVVET